MIVVGIVKRLDIMFGLTKIFMHPKSFSYIFITYEIMDPIEDYATYLWTCKIHEICVPVIVYRVSLSSIKMNNMVIYKIT